MGQQQNFGADHTALAGVIAVLAVVFAVQLFPDAVGGSSHSRLPRAALDLRYMEMKKCDAQSPPAWLPTASLSILCVSGRAKTCSAKYAGIDAQASQGVQPLVRNEVTQNSPDILLSGLSASQSAHTPVRGV